MMSTQIFVRKLRREMREYFFIVNEKKLLHHRKHKSVLNGSFC